MTTRHAEKSLADVAKEVAAWSDHHIRDGRFSHGSRLPICRDEIEAGVTLGHRPASDLIEYDTYMV
jgi:hypothetical protein